MMLIKYALSDFKKYCTDYKKYANYRNYEYSFYTARRLLEQNNHQVIEVAFNRHDYLQWLEIADMQNSYLAQQCWVGNIHQGGNVKQLKNCIICNTSFKGRVDSKFCSNVCRSKNYRIQQKEVRKKKRIMEAIEFAKFVGIDEPNDKIINNINSKPKWQREDLLSIYPKNENYKIMKKKYMKIGVERKIDLLISHQKYIFEKLLL